MSMGNNLIASDLTIKISKLLAIVKAEVAKSYNIAQQNDDKYDCSWEIFSTAARFYEMGFRQIIPVEWNHFENQLQDMEDPDWEKYQELKAKFGGR